MSWNQDNADVIIKEYEPKVTTRSTDPNRLSSWKKETYITETRIPEALFISEYSDTSEFVIIEPEEGIDFIIYNKSFINFVGQISEAEGARGLDKNLIFRVIYSDSSTIMSYVAPNIGESMAASREIILSNGDTEDWVRLDFETYSNEGKIIKALLDAAVGKAARIFDFHRKCWFIQKDVVEPFLKGIDTLVNKGTLRGYIITDKRVIVETFDEFFNKTDDSYKATPAKPKAALLKEMEYILKEHAKVYISLREDCTIVDLKPSYRKAALVLHPDRNNGDGSKMSELNKVWGELQQYL